ncbi:hypothetical protein EGW08_004251 [Elysia chlorotica]|uniref:Uncharacterized protein n=1 Tax=Elysia chlorotica TaxID=188477 RepID=A0A3S0ZVT8_ELYCH|nr:hypothetical protein EGW08_004251 [Elysia chlorotica]
MPFWSHKSNKQSAKRGVHFTAQDQFESSDEPPDSVLDQIRHMKLQKEAARSRSKDRHHHGNGGKADSGKTSGSGHTFIPPPLNRAATAPLPVSSSRCRRSRSVRKSSSLGESLDNWELELHGKRLRELSQIDEYVRYLRQSPEEEAASHMSSRLCCAQVLKTLYLRHERRFVDLLQHTRPAHYPAQPTLDASSPDSESDPGKHGGPRRPICDTPCTSREDDIVLVDDVTDESQKVRQLQPALKKSNPGFFRQQGSRVPVAPKRGGLRLNLAPTPVKASALSPEFGPRTEDGLRLSASRDSFSDVLSDISDNKSKCLSLSESSRCSSNFSMAPFATTSDYAGGYEIY